MEIGFLGLYIENAAVTSCQNAVLRLPDEMR